MSHIMVMETAVSQLVSGCSACERIKNTPMPFAIVVHLRCEHLSNGSAGPFQGLAIPDVQLCISLTGMSQELVFIQAPMCQCNGSGIFLICILLEFGLLCCTPWLKEWHIC